MAKKKKTKKNQSALDDQDTKEEKKLEIRYKTKIIKLSGTKACGGLTEEGAKLTNEQSRLAYRWMKNKEPLLITIGRIETRAVIKKVEAEPGGDFFKYKGFDFTAEQYGKLAGMVKSEKEVEVVIQPDPENMFKDKEKDEETPLLPYKGPPVSGTCSVCGCTEDNPCAGGCSWVDEKKTLCTSCEFESEKAAAKNKKTTKKVKKKASKKQC